jgi:hypothetical protein
MENASRSTECRQAPVGVGARAFAAVIVLLLTVPEAIAAKLGGPYYVDDAEIGKVGSCEIESWASFAANKDHIYVFSPACVLNLGAPVELGTNLVNLRSEGVGDSTASLTAKIVPLPIGGGGFALALSGAFVYDLTDKNINSVILNVPLTYDFGKHLRFNINVGAQYIRGDSRDIGQNPPGLFATAGAGVAWNVVKEWSVISEVFALMGPGQSNPRFQSGLRYSPTKDVDWDVIYGRNLTGEGANWVTVALTIRTGDD